MYHVEAVARSREMGRVSSICKHKKGKEYVVKHVSGCLQCWTNVGDGIRDEQGVSDILSDIRILVRMLFSRMPQADG